MGFENYDLIWQELEAVMKKYGYQICILNNNPNPDVGIEDVITAVFSKESSNED